MRRYPVQEERLSHNSHDFESLNFVAEPTPTSRNHLAYENSALGIYLFHANCLEMMDSIISKYPHGCFDMIFADPPYFLSNGGITCHAGKMVKVDKGDWDKSRGIDLDHEFNLEWLKRCQKLLNKDGTIWVSGTMHAIYSIGFAMQKLGYKILNDIIWEKPNPPPNLSKRYFVHSTESLIWAAKSPRSRHQFNNEAMASISDGKQMKSVWRLKPAGPDEKHLGKHPTQKPVELVERCIAATTSPGQFILDPFCGSSTTGIAAIKTRRRYCGIEMDQEFIDLSVRRINTML